MTLEELKYMCEQAIETQTKPKPTITLVRPPGKSPKGFPRGTLLCENSKGERVYHFDAVRMLKWTKKMVNQVEKENG